MSSRSSDADTQVHEMWDGRSASKLKPNERMLPENIRMESPEHNDYRDLVESIEEQLNLKACPIFSKETVKNEEFAENYV